MTEAGPIFDESIKGDVLNLRDQLSGIWGKLERAGLVDRIAFEGALLKYPHLKKFFIEGRPQVRDINKLRGEDYLNEAGYQIILFSGEREGTTSHDEVLRTQVELYPSGKGIIGEWDFSGDAKTGKKREYTPDRPIVGSDLPMVESLIRLVVAICNQVP